MNFIAYIWLTSALLHQYLIFGEKSTIRAPNVPFWEKVNGWSKCSTTCGEGYQEKLFECFKRTFYLIENIPTEKCLNAVQPKPILKKCNYGNCDQQYIWKISEWGKCSHSCGYAGTQMNEVECYMKGNKYTVTDPQKCDASNRPSYRRSCNRFNCPVHFQPSRWGNCTKTSDCAPGKQRRSLSCLSLLHSGKILQLPPTACYQKGVIPPASWKKCFDHIDENKCIKNNVIPEPEIIDQKRVLVQMRRVGKLNLHVGHIAYIIPGTKVLVTCPVKNYFQMNLVWIFKQHKYAYKGKTKNRIRVNKKGRLAITSFLIQDQGEWICKAKNVTASVIMKLKSPSDGFKDWAIRNTLWNKDMPNEDSKMDMMNQEVIRWVTGSWSRCSISCDGTGTQSRFVRCEKLENRYYFQLDDSECRKRFDKKPQTNRECRQPLQCPKWILHDANLTSCTDKCLNFGKGAVGGKLKCIYQNESIEHERCDPNSKPFLECDNPLCVVKWKISSWTKCSRTCGDMGIQARYLICVWNNTNELAGNLCYKAEIAVPRVIKACKPPKCNVECIDLYKNCKKKHYCQIGMYSFRCCKTCRTYFRSRQKKATKKHY